MKKHAISARIVRAIMWMACGGLISAGSCATDVRYNITQGALSYVKGTTTGISRRCA